MMKDDDDDGALTFEALEAQSFAALAVERARLHASADAEGYGTARTHAAIDRGFDMLVQRQADEFTRIRARLQREGFFDDD